MIVESRQTIMEIFELSQQQSEIFAIPIFSDVYTHPAENTLALLYLASSSKDYIIPVNHPDSDIQFTYEQVEGI